MIAKQMPGKISVYLHKYDFTIHLVINGLFDRWIEKGDHEFIVNSNRSRIIKQEYYIFLGYL